MHFLGFGHLFFVQNEKLNLLLDFKKCMKMEKVVLDHNGHKTKNPNFHLLLNFFFAKINYLKKAI